jgi:hypothetical protein
VTQYLRKYELVALVHVNRTTLSHWIKEFSEFVPVHKQGDVECYGYEAIALLMRVKELREQLYYKSTIKKILTNERFPLFLNKDTS